MKYLNNKEFMIIFGRRIKVLRKEKNLSQSALGGLAELEKTAIQRIERGYNSTIKTLLKLANAFDVSLAELFDFSAGDKE